MNLRIRFVVLAVIGFVLTACGGNTVMDVTLPAEIGTNTPGPTPTATPIPTSLVVCLGEAPNTLYPYGAPNRAAQNVLQALYDGPIDHRGYQYQPVLLEALPDLADGTAILQTVQVQAGDTVLDNQGNIVILEYGMFIRPAGCFSSKCAESFDGNPLEMDQMAAIFTLRQGITWANGNPLTVADSVFGFTLNAAEETQADKYKVERTFSYEAVNENTIQWTGIPGFIDPDYQNNFWMPAPEHAWGEFSPAELAQSEQAAEMPLGFGSFNVLEFSSEQIVLQRNPAYFRASEGLPRVDKVIFRVVGQGPQLNRDMLLTGECDLLDPTAVVGLGVGEIMALMADGKITSTWANDNGWTLFNFGITPQSYDDGYEYWAGERPDFFGDVRARQAIATCIDRQAIIDETALGVTPLMDSYIPNDHPLFNPEILNYSYDPEAATDLLEEIGWILNQEGHRTASGIEGIRDGTRFEFELLYVEHPQNKRVVEVAVENLAQCGITVAPVGLDAEELFTTGEDAPVFGRNFDMVYYAWQSSEQPPCHLFFSEAIPGKDEEIFPYKWGGWNASGWMNEDYDSACKAARGSAPGQEAYQENHALAQSILMEELPMIPLFHFQHAALARPDICGLQLDATGGLLWNIENIAYGPDCPDS
jgi:peptide/nickel transport system substrate-binding protein